MVSFPVSRGVRRGEMQSFSRGKRHDFTPTDTPKERERESYLGGYLGVLGGFEALESGKIRVFTPSLGFLRRITFYDNNSSFRTI